MLVMNYFRQTKKQTLFLWILLISIALLCAQGVKLHTHFLDHEHNQQHSHDSIGVTAEHAHLSDSHLSTDVSHGDHHGEVVLELDASPDGVLKKGSSSVPMLALFAAILSFLLFNFAPLALQRRGNDITIPQQFFISPPLRGPPL